MHATPAIDLALPVKRQVISVFGDGDVGERAFGRQTALDQPVGRVCLNDACVAAATGISRANGDNDMEAGGNDVEPFGTIFARCPVVVCLQTMKGGLHHVGATTGADLLCRFDHPFDARQMVWQMAEVAFGCRASGFAVGIAFSHCIPRGLSLSNSRLQIFKSQLARIRVQLLGPLAIKRMAQLGDKVILTFGLGLQPSDLGLHRCKRLTHGGRKGIQIKGENGGCGHGNLYSMPAQLPIFTRQSESFCRSGRRRSGRVDAAPIKARKQRLKLNPRKAHDAVANLGPRKTTLL